MSSCWSLSPSYVVKRGITVNSYNYELSPGKHPSPNSEKIGTHNITIEESFLQKRYCSLKIQQHGHHIYVLI